MCIAALFCTLAAVPAQEAELSFDIWDWTAPAKDVALFDTWVADLARLGFTRVEISVPWRVIEPREGAYDTSWLTDRLGIIRKHGLGARLRINSYYAGATPDWYDGAWWQDPEGNIAPAALPSITDERFWRTYGPFVTEVAKAADGYDVYYNAFIGVHAELKWAGWFSFDAPTLARWREAIAAPRPAWLRAVVPDDVPLPETPPTPGPTNGTPHTDPAVIAHIAFRQQVWRDAMDRFVEYVHAGDPDGRISAPLGESYRRQSADFSNLDYAGLTDEADQVVHSYDFFWHVEDPVWQAAAAVASFRGITGLPVAFEYDAPDNLLNLGYTPAQLVAMGREAHAAGAGLKVANHSYSEVLPSDHRYIPDLVRVWKSGLPRDATLHAPPEETVLLFLSKWANYLYMEPTEWLHEAQFGLWRLLEELAIPVRIICEDNLDEDLARYRALVVGFSPPALMPPADRARLEALDLPRVTDVPAAPEPRDGQPVTIAGGLADVALGHDALPVRPIDLAGLGDGWTFALEAGPRRFAGVKDHRAVLGYPLGYLYLHGDDPDAHAGIFLDALTRVLCDGLAGEGRREADGGTAETSR